MKTRLEDVGAERPPVSLPAVTGQERGDIAIVTALMLPVMLMLIGGSLDYGLYLRQKTRLQAAADMAAMAAGKELSLIDYTRTDATGMTSAIVNSAMSGNSQSMLRAGPVSVTTTTETSPLRVTITATQTAAGYFNALNLVPSTITVQAVAQVIGRPNVCVVALDPGNTKGAVYLEKEARMTGQNCAVYSNSTHTSGVFAKNNAVLTASMICSAGGNGGGSGNFNPQPFSDCPTFDDPLASRAAPPVGSCVASNLSINNQTVTLQPGAYCGGISISGSSSVTFAAGIYVIKDGPLKVDNSASITGADTGFYFVGNSASFFFNTGTTISLTAPKGGAMAGLLFFEDQKQTATVHQILSDNARMLLGTIYLPVSELKVDANQPIADQSAYTAIVARTITLYSGPNLILNTNYDLTPVPVPEGMKGVGQPVALTR